MELAMTNGFSELSFDEMETIDGGGPWDCLDKFYEGLTGKTMAEGCEQLASDIKRGAICGWRATKKAASHYRPSLVTPARFY